jgi:hypothetical protein
MSIDRCHPNPVVHENVERGHTLRAAYLGDLVKRAAFWPVGWLAALHSNLSARARLRWLTALASRGSYHRAQAHVVSK